MKLEIVFYLCQLVIWSLFNETENFSRMFKT